MLAILSKLHRTVEPYVVFGNYVTKNHVAKLVGEAESFATNLSKKGRDILPKGVYIDHIDAISLSKIGVSTIIVVDEDGCIEKYHFSEKVEKGKRNTVGEYSPTVLLDLVSI